MRVLTLMRQRGLGNGSMQLQKKLDEEHHEAWLQRVAHYLTDCKAFADAHTSRLVLQQEYPEPPTQIPVPKYQWLQMVYCSDVMRRVDSVKAAITGTFGKVIKMDSTKKV